MLTAVRVSLSAMFGTLGSRLQRFVKHKDFTTSMLPPYYCMAAQETGLLPTAMVICRLL